MEFVRNEVDALYHEMVADAMGAQSEYNEGPMAEEPNSKARESYDLLHAAKVHIVCGESHYEPRNMSTIRQKDIPRKSLWYLPITPRLQRLYMSRKTAKHMTWHLKCCEDVDEVIHLASSEAWKQFDKTHPTFVDEPRNVRLGLCTDGFNPFGCSTIPSSCWPIFLTMYNLPPELCMKLEHIFLAMIIAKPKSLGKNIDVMLMPLIDELKELWTNGVETYDSFRFELELIPQDDGTTIKPNATYVLTREQQSSYLLVAEEIEIPRWRLLPIAFCDFLTDEVWGPLTKISNFFRALTALIIQVSNMKMWEEKFVETICKLEKVFPPAFFDSMEHLAIHLPYEVKVGGLVQFHWMYSFERLFTPTSSCRLFDYPVHSDLSDDQIQIKRQLEFIPWFKTTVHSGRYKVDSRLLPLVTGPVNNVRAYNGIVVHPTSGIVDINPRFKLQTYEPFILASQAQQVFYARYPSQNPCRKGWFAACKIRGKAIIDTSSLSDGGNVYYQDDDPPMPQLVQPSTILNDHVSLASQGGEQVVISEVMQLPYVAEEECVGEDDDEEEEFDGTETSKEEVPNYLTENIRRDTRDASSRQQVDPEGEPQRPLRRLIRGPRKEQPTVTQPPLDDDQYTGDDATMEEDTEERNLEAELDGRGTDKGYDAPTDPSQRRMLSLNH
ncbi:hypothetical protein SLEP1_g14272 [Rubroshorea leprosula]|uniref:DUF4218 domain-containing protein n=1 Tax=Rubroshorea leprosula TaxID=152421 RepID=A0AAV5ISJ0_9ROSI|nr:hypothetical protein SLEP1_g14272 [Rubroshorea leprosula]